ncbi:MAG: C25 family cysteine peptidase [Thermoanaerobaculia bacterium]
MSAVLGFLASLSTNAASAANTPDAGRPRPALKIALSEPGVYRLSFADLVAAGWSSVPTASAGLHLSCRAKSVPIAVDDGGDGIFGPGDTILFVGDRLAGDHGYYNEFSSLNIYRLTDAGAPPFPAAASAGGDLDDRLRPGKAQFSSPGIATSSAWQERLRLEEDRILLRYPLAGVEDQELWYWTKLSYLDARQFEVPIDLGSLAPFAAPALAASAGTVASGADGDAELRIAIEVRGWSKPRTKPTPEFADHAIEVFWDDAVVGRHEWSGTEKAEEIEIRLKASGIVPGIHRLGVRVPERPADGAQPLVDVSILNWLEIVAPQSGALGLAPVRVAAPIAPLDATAGTAAPPADPAAPHVAAAALVGQKRLEPRAPLAAGPRRVAIPVQSAFDLVTDGGERYSIAATAAPRELDLPEGSAFWAVPAGRFLKPVRMDLDRPSSWRLPSHQADYLLVSHSRLRAATAPLAALRRAQGLTVAEIDIDDVYDEWNDGIVDPRALRAFVDYAVHHWQAPAPKFLLLVGDASWDGKSDQPTAASPDWAFRLSDRAEFIQNGSTPYAAEAVSSSRNLIPTWGYGSFEGHAAGDNYFVAVDGEDDLPDLAVGRFPVVEPREVEAIVAKIVAYETAPPPGDWRTRVLLVTNEEKGIQESSDRLAIDLAQKGLTSAKIYPQPVDSKNTEDQVALRRAFDDGALLVHFMGHGGRYIWRTAAPDFASQRDLFDLSDVERLHPSGELPVVLSLTCYSAPFDHPTADSIGEKLLREPGKGAVAVFAASWRNSPWFGWSDALFAELLRPGTIGEALQRVKRSGLSLDLLQQYNLLGDPAMRLALPADRPIPAPPIAGEKEALPSASGSSADGKPGAE